MTNPIVTLTTAFAISRIAFYLAGIRFVATGFWQLLDFRLLRHDLLSSIWYMNMQPPLYNLYIGGVLILPGAAERPFVVGCWLLLGLVLVLSCYLLLIELRVPRTVALVVTLVGVVASPSYVLAENWSFLTYPSTCLLLLAALLLARYLRTRQWGYALGFSCAAASVVLLNTTYQWIWLVPVLVIAVGTVRERRHTVLTLLLVPLLVVGVWYAKNAVMFGTTTTSSWVGMNLAKLALQGAPATTIHRLVREGRLTPLALVPPFSDPSVYIPRFVSVPKHTGISALDEIYEDETGAPPFIVPLGGAESHYRNAWDTNWNNLIYIKVSDQYLHDDISFIEDDPGLYIRDLRLSLENWFTPSDQYIGFGPGSTETNWGRIHGYIRIYDSAVEWQPKLDTNVFGLTLFQHVPPSLLTLSYQAIVTFALTILGVPFLIRRRTGDRVLRGTLAFIWFTVLYATLVTSLIELGENNRYRFELGPLPLIAGTVVVLAMFRSTRLWKRNALHLKSASAPNDRGRSTLLGSR